MRWCAGLFDFENQVKAVAEERAQSLLRSWLSLAQRAQYNANGYFDVVGSDSGKIYRIHRGTVFNIEELLPHRAAVRAWCFAPPGLPKGDVNLAQKIALETSEREVLSLANARF